MLLKKKILLEKLWLQQLDQYIISTNPLFTKSNKKVDDPVSFKRTHKKYRRKKFNILFVIGVLLIFFVHVMRTHNPRNRTIYTRKYNVQTDKQTTDKDNFYYWISNLLFLRLQYTSINHNALSSAKRQKSNLQSVSYVVYHFCNVYKSITSFWLDFDLSCKKFPKVVKFTFSEKTTKIDKIFTAYFTLTT